MLGRLIEYAMRQRVTVLLATIVLIGVGSWSALKLPIDAVPDITNPQVQINTAVPALAPEEVEKLVTFPIESEMSGLPDMMELRSLSKFGLSQVTMTFKDGVDLYRMRQLVTERLQGVLDELPEGLSPKLAPVATGLGEIFYYSLDYTEDAEHKPATREEQLMALAQIQEYQVKPLLRGTKGVVEVNTSGGYEKQIVIQPDPARLASRGLSLDSLAEIVEQNTKNSGGGYVEIGGEQLIVRAPTRVNTIEEIASLPLKFGGGVKPILLSEVATVSIGSNFRTGASTDDGKESLVGAAIMLAGENSRLVAKAVRARLDEIQEKLPHGVVIRPLYDRSELVNRTIATVEKNLAEGALLVVVVLFLLLGNWRAAFIVALVIPLSMQFAISGMVQWHLSGNLMSLGAIDFGLIIDGAVVMVENIVRHLGERQHELGRKLTSDERRQEVLRSAREVANPMFFGVLIITVVYVPILALQGIEGKMFQPMALVVMLALGGSLVLALFLMPVLCSYLLGGNIKEKDNWLVTATKRVYAPLLKFGLRFRLLVVLPMVLLFCSSIWLFTKMGAEFIPQLDEGDFAFQLIRSSSAGLSASLELQKQSEAVIRKEFPEVKEIFSRIGTAEVATDPMNPNVADTYIMLKPREQWRQKNGKPISKEELGALMRKALLDQVPGQNILVTQPIQMRFNEIMAGARADLVCKVFGDSYDELERLAGEVRTAIMAVPGGGETEFDSIGKNPMIEIQPDREALRKFNVHADDLNRLIETALAGAEVGMVIEGNRRSPIEVRLSDERRNDIAAMSRLPLRTEEGSMLTLGQVAKIQLVPQPVQIAREDTQRRVSILINVRGRDTESFVQEATRAIHEKVKFPDGYYFEFGGQFKNLVEARERLLVVVPMALALIFALIFLSFGSLRQAALIFTCVPLAVTGGIFALYLRGMPFTISAAVGFIALSGIAVLNGIMLISFINQLRTQGLSLRDAVVEGTLTRLRPKLMTAFVASLGFVPMAIATGAGAEVQRPIATVVIGGIITSTFLTLLVVPVLYEWIERNTNPKPKSEPEIRTL
ncbi:cobalt-zinc-cadmium resistance protein CzcA [Roseimicrobium gellanilyticum]|uniref:Cobalt-zinc-cadmium resistance protein CzcA n=1 Tax=Roseimicrobium gellanilyticum TaxID=748857 RepID=A0A366HAI4_9BACT|nr:CusA/CzcA family heavy metal efflux RND transporter [Roseimicrobium gellanilyticum]RBP38592.1 cobalt-zinc-cadmium resistance protein CzcA [Roseimicrobium gellanilyticum]